MKCCCFNPANKHTVISIVGLSISFTELILASIYNFHAMGFAMSVIGLLTSSLYIYGNFRALQQHGSNMRSTNSNDETQQTLVSQSTTSLNILKAQMAAEEEKKSARWSGVVWVIYICLIVVLTGMSFCRLVGLFRRIEWRQHLDGAFPAACGDWATEHGCTRITLTSCTRQGSIPDSNSVIFDEINDQVLNTQIKQCINHLEGSKLMSPHNLNDLDTNSNLIHVTFNSAIFGFIDDMYIMQLPY